MISFLVRDVSLEHSYQMEIEVSCSSFSGLAAGRSGLVQKTCLGMHLGKCLTKAALSSVTTAGFGV